ncbi:MAG TPA: hypothetical protein VN818_07295 [Gammaproteobacteria bacterium]|nr:hypothetical protein [Gammaproteobacteria bacterium]
MRPVVLIVVLGALAIATAVALRYGATRLDSVVASTVERYGSAVTGTDVEVDGVDLALTAGRAHFTGLTVDNPKGYDTDYAVRIGTATVALDVGSLAGEVPVVKELELDGALINAEQRDAASNLTDIQKHAAADSGGAPAGEPGRIVVERFRLRNARVLVTSEHLSKPEELPLPDVVVENIGTASGGATYSEAAEAMLMPVIAAAKSAAAERLRDVAGAAVSQATREELDERSQELREQSAEKSEEVSEKVEELLDRR